MSESFRVITALVYGRDNDAIGEIQDNVKQSVVFDPGSGAWLLGVWEDSGGSDE